MASKRSDCPFCNAKESILVSACVMNDKYNRVILYVRTGDPSNFSKSAQED